ncbi:MFS transporter [soil metagenome]
MGAARGGGPAGESALTALAQAPAPSRALAPGAPFGPRVFVGVMGVLVAALMSGLSDRVGDLALIDIRGVHGFGVDDGQWLSIVYTAAELIAMPLTFWFAVTLSFRRYHMGVTAAFMLIALLLPFAPNYGWMLALRAGQGLMGGALIPLLMGAALRFFPASLRLYGLSLYALTATFAPNVAVWIAALWTDQLSDWRLVYWQSVPLGGFALWAVWWGIPQDPVRLERFGHFDLLGLVSAFASLAMLVIAMEQGERLDWFHSSLFTWLLFGGLALFVVFLASQWFHPVPYVKLHLLERRNLWLAFVIFMGTLAVLLSGSMLPADQLVHVGGFRPLQLAPIGLAIALPQFVLGPLTAFLLYQKWADARRVMALGLLLLAVSCFLGASVTSDWMVAQFWTAQVFQALGQPLAVVSLLFVATSAITPMEGPLVSGIINGLRVIGTFLGGIGISYHLAVRTDAHERGLLDRLGRIVFDPGASHAELAARVGQQAFTLSIADSYRLLGLLALALIPLTFFLFHTPPPAIPPRASKGI